MTSTLIDTSGQRLYLVTGNSVGSWPGSGTCEQVNVDLFVETTLTETDLTFTAVPVGGGFSIDALADGAVIGQVPAQLIANGPEEDNPDHWGVSVVVYADDASLYGVTGADSFRLNGYAYFLVSPVYAKF